MPYVFHLWIQQHSFLDFFSGTLETWAKLSALLNWQSYTEDSGTASPTLAENVSVVDISFEDQHNLAIPVI